MLKVVGVLVFSAIPFTAVKAIANSPLGESLQRRLEEKKKVSLQNSSKFRALSEKARNERYYSLLLFANPLKVCSKSIMFKKKKKTAIYQKIETWGVYKI